MGLALHDLRRRKLLLQSIVAQQVGVSPSTLSRFENGAQTMSLQQFLDLTAALGIERPGAWLDRQLDKWEKRNGGEV